jgi:hypothetical protein
MPSQTIRLPAWLALIVSMLGALPAAAQNINESRKLTASDAAADDQFGFSVSISGTTAIVGANGDSDAGFDSGAAYLFNTITGQELFRLTASDPAAGDLFGFSVAISGNIAIVGAYRDDDAGNNSGSAYLFSTTTGQQLFKLTASDAAADAQFGSSVAISGTTVIVGAFADSGAGAGAGAAYVFDVTDPLNPVEVFKLTASDAAANDLFGFSVAISGNTAIVGADNNDDAGSNSGSAYIFDTTTGQQLFKLIASDASANNLFGRSVAISGTTAVVGAAFGGNAGITSGTAFVFDTTTGQQLFKLTASDAAAGDLFGDSVGIFGTTAIVGASSDDDGGSGSGSAYVFDTITGQQVLKLTASDAAAGDELGTSVAISGTSVIVGAVRDDDAGSDSGSAYLYYRTPKLVQQPQSTIVTVGETASFSVMLEDETGASYQWRRDGVALSDDSHISGSQTATLQIIASLEDIGVYACVATNPRGSTRTEDVLLAVRPGLNACFVDVNGDGLVNFFDIQIFINAFSAGCP